MRFLAPIIAVVAVLIVSGCSDDGGGTTITEPRVPGPTDTIVVFEQVGGIAGVRERLDVRPDGAARIESGAGKVEVKRFKLTPGELDGLRAARDRVDFSKLEKQYGPEQPVADGVASTITTDDGEVTVLTEGDPPPELARLIAVCAGIVDQHS
jgi:hypothetical protein